MYDKADFMPLMALHGQAIAMVPDDITYHNNKILH